jgi:hypothetical protein
MLCIHIFFVLNHVHKKYKKIYIEKSSLYNNIYIYIISYTHQKFTILHARKKNKPYPPYPQQQQQHKYLFLFHHHLKKLSNSHLLP